MDLLGIVEEITTDGKIVLRCQTTPEIGNAVFDQKNRRVGTIKRIFGPVDTPYSTVIVEEGYTVRDLKNKPLYFTKGAQYGKNKRRNRRD